MKNMKSTYIVYETESLEVIAKISGEDDACHSVAYDRFEKELDKHALYEHKMIDVACLHLSHPPIDPDDEIPDDDVLYSNMDDGQVIDADLYCASLSKNEKCVVRELPVTMHAPDAEALGTYLTGESDTVDGRVTFRLQRQNDDTFILVRPH
jgi:hypothetical protein